MKTKPYILVAVMHSGKTVVKELPNHEELKKEVEREKQNKAFYSHCIWETRNGNLKKVVFNNRQTSVVSVFGKIQKSTFNNKPVYYSTF